MKEHRRAGQGGGLVEIVQELLGDVPVLRVRGDLDRLNAAALEQAFRVHLRAGTHRLALDLSRCPYLDSGGLAAILVTAGELRDDGLLAIVAPRVSIRRLLELVGLYEHRHCAVFRAEKEAMSALTASPQRTVL
jgi:anti-anti-sigma factor